MDKVPFYIKISLFFVGLYAFVSILYAVQDILIPLVYATILAIVLSPVVNFLIRKKFGRILAIALPLVVSFLFIVSFIYLLGSQASLLRASFPAMATKFQQLLNQFIVWIPDHIPVSNEKIRDWISSSKNELIGNSRYMIGQTLLYTGNFLVVSVLIPVYIFMILYYKKQLLDFVHKSFSTARNKEVDEVIMAIKRIVKNYLVGLMLETGIIALLYFISLLLLGIDYAFLLAVISSLINIIPYVGGLVGVLFPVAIAITTRSLTYTLLVVAVYILVQQVDNHYIRPRIVGSKVKINALVSVIAVIAGEALWGMPGMLLSIPLVAIAKVIFDHIRPLKPLGEVLGDST